MYKIRPFLPEWDDNVTSIGSPNSTLLEEDTEDTHNTQITTLYPLIGLMVILISFGYLTAGCVLQSDVFKSAPKDEEKPQKDNYDGKTWTLLILVALFFFFYVGAEVSFGTYILTFAVECDMKLTKTTGAEITSLFWGSFAFMRFASIFTAVYLRLIDFNPHPLHRKVPKYDRALISNMIL